MNLLNKNKKFFYLSGSIVVAVLNAPSLIAMTRPALEQQTIFAPLRTLADGFISTPSTINQAFSDTFSHICVMVSQQHNPEENIRWLTSEGTGEALDTLIHRLWEHVNHRYFLAEQMEITTFTLPCGQQQLPSVNGNLYFTFLWQALGDNETQLHKKMTALTRLLEDIAAGKQAISYLDHAPFLQETIEQQIRWEPFRAAWQTIKDCCAIP